MDFLTSADADAGADVEFWTSADADVKTDLKNQAELRPIPSDVIIP